MIHRNFLQLNVREPDDVGAYGNITLGVGCNTLTVEQIVRICGMNRANCDTSTKVRK